MKMAIADPDPPHPRHESLTQRQRRQQRESEARGRPKSKVELARGEREKREAALARSIIDAEAERSNKGLRIMKMMGFDPDSRRQHQEPIAIALKDDRAGIGHASAAASAQKKRKFDDLDAAGSGRGGEQGGSDPGEYRDRVRAERHEKRLAAQLHAAQSVCEGLDMKRDYGVDEGSLGQARRVPLRGINVLWRSLVRRREELERARRLRHDMEQGLALAQPPPHRLPLSGSGSGSGSGHGSLLELDEADRVALGLSPLPMRGFVDDQDQEEDNSGGGDDGEGEEDEDDDDPELAEFEALGFDERLRRIVDYLRHSHHYCFWCKYTYEDDAMDGCPGPEEDLHG